MYKGTVTIELHTPVEWEGDEIKTIALNFGKVTPAAIIEAEQNSGGSLTSIVKMANTSYCTHLASHMMGREPKTAYRILMKMDVEDFNAVWQTVGAYVGDNDPQEFYNQYTGVEATADAGFTKPAGKPE